MNAQTVQLLSILSACRPDDEELARESRIGRIMQSEDYQALMHRQAFAGLMQDHFTEAKLRTYTAEQLDRARRRRSRWWPTGTASCQSRSSSAQ